MKQVEIREKFLNFFKERGHKIVPSSPLVPENDATTLFTGSGMQPMIPYLLGEKHPLGTRIADSQKSFRAEDIDEVGDNRHTTFFEMLGNWSLGDYWKKEQLAWIFEFLTKEIGLDPNKIYVTVFAGDSSNGISKDTESTEIWKSLFAEKGIDAKDVELLTEEKGGELGMQGGRIFFYDSKKNWWSRAGVPENMPSGEPGGPDSEIFYCFESVEHNSNYGKHCHPNCDCGKFMEIGNNVFMEYKKRGDGSFEKLSQKNVDFGGGLERITAASNDHPDVFKIDSFSRIIEKIRSFPTKLDDRSERIIADHIRAATFLIGDGVIPSNKDRGYIVRRLIRRAVTYTKKFGIDDLFTHEVAEITINYYSDFYPELFSNKNRIMDEIRREESKFRKTLQTGLKILGDKKSITGKEAFDLFQTHGFPLELTKELGSIENEKEFEEEFKKHQELSRTASAGQFKGGLASHSEKIIRLHTATHLINAALREVLGKHVWQKGSNITEERTRFDFTHDKKLTDEDKHKIEDRVNEWVRRDLEVKKEVMSQDEARKLGAIGMFGEKYGDTVSIYTVFDLKTNEIISREFCGGPHVSHTAEVGKIKITKEEAVSAGVRRIRAVAVDLNI